MPIIYTVDFTNTPVFVSDLTLLNDVLGKFIFDNETNSPLKNSLQRVRFNYSRQNVQSFQIIDNTDNKSGKSGDIVCLTHAEKLYPFNNDWYSNASNLVKSYKSNNAYFTNEDDTHGHRVFFDDGKNCQEIENLNYMAYDPHAYDESPNFIRKVFATVRPNTPSAKFYNNTVIERSFYNPRNKPDMITLLYTMKQKPDIVLLNKEKKNTPTPDVSIKIKFLLAPKSLEGKSVDELKKMAGRDMKSGTLHVKKLNEKMAVKKLDSSSNHLIKKIPATNILETK